MTFDGGAGHSPLFPKIVKGNELDGLVTFNGISVLRPKKGVSRIGVHLGCPWDEEHGMGILIAGDEIESVGISEVVDLPASELEWPFVLEGEARPSRIVRRGRLALQNRAS